MASDTIHLQSHFKGLKVCVDGGEMDYAQAKGRTPRVSKQPTYLAFVAGLARVERETLRSPSAPWKDADWKDLKAKTRAEAVEALKRLAGFGVDFTITDAVVEAGVREPAGAAK